MRRAIVTGGSRGIGREIVAVLKAAGFDVVAPSRQELDLLSDASIDGFVSSLRGEVHALVNNAGINRISDVLEMTDKDLKETFQTNYFAPVRLIRAVTPLMGNGGNIVNISSIWGTVTRKGRASYSASKAALDSFTRSCAVELASKNVLVNSLAPGYIETELTSSNNTPSEMEEIKKKIPLCRFGTPAEIADLVLFLCARNTYMTGQVILVDGGYTCL